MVKSFKDQSYSSLKKNAIKGGLLFEDSEFPANNKSIFFSKIDNDIEWKRPKELCKVPKLIVEGVSCDDLNHGELGNNWFVTACTSLAQEPKLWQKVVPNYKEQEWDEKNEYGGIFKFQFWRFGDWVEVVIDDRLPTKNGKLIFCHSKSRNEFWSALLEKAYAKLYGDYESLSTGHVADALVDFSGAVAEKLEIAKLKLNSPDAKKKLFTDLKESMENRAMITCSIECGKESIGNEGQNGLMLGYGYIVTDVKHIAVQKSLQGAMGSAELEMLRVFNPWGTKEWTGAWSDHSAEWKRVNPRELEKMGIKFNQEGEFWMCFEDFISNFTNVEVCHFVNTSFFTIKKTWSECIMHSEWSHSGRNGGGDYDSATFLSNPQYLFDIPQDRDTVMVSLEQHDVKPGRQNFGQELNNIGYHIMRVEDNRKFRVHIQGDKMFTSEYLKSRSIFGRLKLARGRYVIVPTTKDNGTTGQFMMRLYTGSNASGRELTKEGPSKGCPCSSVASIVTTITIKKATGVEPPADKKTKSIDPLVIVKCENEKVKSQHARNTKDPEWNMKLTFYRKKPSAPITIEVWNHNIMVDDFMAEARVEEHGGENGKEVEQKLYGRKKEGDVVKPGKLFIHVRTSQDLQYL